jgi:hypothetical protein
MLELFSYTSPDNTIGNLFQGDLGELFSYTSPDNTIGNLFQGNLGKIFSIIKRGFGKIYIP